MVLVSSPYPANLLQPDRPDLQGKPRGAFEEPTLNPYLGPTLEQRSIVNSAASRFDMVPGRRPVPGGSSAHVYGQRRSRQFRLSGSGFRVRV